MRFRFRCVPCRYRVGASNPAGGDAQAHGCGPDPACRPQLSLDRNDGGRDVPIIDCRTNASGSACAWADAHSGLENFLACSLETTGPIALCYCSGVPGKPLLPPDCTLSHGRKAAGCTCCRISQGKPKGACHFSSLVISILTKRDGRISKLAEAGGAAARPCRAALHGADRPLRPVPPPAVTRPGPATSR